VYEWPFELANLAREQFVMQVTINDDRSVIPKPLRDALGLDAGTTVAAIASTGGRRQ
jgi:bifunctional DNA-binding transcriptional regulator/antitoxin component of YhaV-PrlF toxin-antitoxin module